jgi:hypothetical protein
VSHNNQNALHRHLLYCMTNVFEKNVKTKKKIAFLLCRTSTTFFFGVSRYKQTTKVGGECGNDNTALCLGSWQPTTLPCPWAALQLLSSVRKSDSGVNIPTLSAVILCHIS